MIVPIVDIVPIEGIVPIVDIVLIEKMGLYGKKRMYIQNRSAKKVQKKRGDFSVWGINCVYLGVE